MRRDSHRNLYEIWHPCWILSPWIHTKGHNTLLGTHTGFSSLWILTKLHNMIFGTHAGISPHGLTPKLITLYSKSSDDTTLDRIILL